MKDFDVIEDNLNDVQIIPGDEAKIVKNPNNGNKLMDAVADNFGTILDLSSSLLEIRKMKVQSDITIKQMEQARQNLLAETEAYCKKKEANTKSVSERWRIVRDLMNDFYAHSSNLTSEDFCKIITEIVNQLGRMEND